MMITVKNSFIKVKIILSGMTPIMMPNILTSILPFLSIFVELTTQTFKLNISKKNNKKMLTPILHSDPKKISKSNKIIT